MDGTVLNKNCPVFKFVALYVDNVNFILINNFVFAFRGSPFSALSGSPFPIAHRLAARVLGRLSHRCCYPNQRFGQHSKSSQKTCSDILIKKLNPLISCFHGEFLNSNTTNIFTDGKVSVTGRNKKSVTYSLFTITYYFNCRVRRLPTNRL